MFNCLSRKLKELQNTITTNFIQTADWEYNRNTSVTALIFTKKFLLYAQVLRCRRVVFTVVSISK
ncbi:CGH_1_HP_G0102990.mRNA.1.CDS.1 [Saccharomyces cerevisiae]|nr:CGH_1_HP_G0102990.mRNA.1.CDS.1 [Saccharomyces cerevisiae]CAI6950118.1 CGH_1_HP_G0102990.mRNA.1.CDS.1 [Saccharomyces cerevisiae]